MDKKVEAGRFVVSLWRSNNHPAGMDWLDTCIDMVIERDATARAEALGDAESKYKADAERLAEALENALLYVSGYANNFEEITIARATLAAHEKGEG